MTLRTRLATAAAAARAVRDYFAAAGVVEVATPALVAWPTAEPTLTNLTLGRRDGRRFLRTSPEAALKRLLAAGSGDLYEFGPAWRADENGRLHREEFTLVEWYRLGFDHHRLMDDVAGLLATCGFGRPIDRVRYAAVFTETFGVDPHRASDTELVRLADEAGVTLPPVADRALLFDALFAARLEAVLARRGAIFLYDFPLELRAYARLSTGEPAVAARFELVVDGVELANGYHEITSPDEQAACFAAENALRRQRGLPTVMPDADWLAALDAGLPACAGVALGFERLVMVLAAGRDLGTVAWRDPAAPAPSRS
ncbi:MAG: EF-P lysine aminoacylase EpmA [Gammaproteobacteria bacterium]